MKTAVRALIGLLLLPEPLVAGEKSLGSQPRPYRWAVSVESAQIFGVNNPNEYHLAPQILSLVRNFEPRWAFAGWDATPELMLSAIAEPVLHGPEDHYFGGALRGRLVFSRGASRWKLYADLGAGAGAIDSSGPPYGQGQDFTFVILAGAGVRYSMSERWSIGLGILYQHLSNAGLSEPHRPNTGLDSFGPNVSVIGAF